MGGTLRISNFKILSIEDIKLPDPRSQNFSFLAIKGEVVGVAKIYANGNDNGNGA
jgi:hypothetical protein